jgi:drug/metabolite transporter (DMT)-like permease
MNVEWVAIVAGVIGGALALLGLYLLAAKKAAKTGERAFTTFVWGLSLLSLMHGIGLCIVTAVVWAGASSLDGPIPETDCRFMGLMILAGIVFVFLGGMGLWTRRPPAADRPTS